MLVAYWIINTKVRLSDESLMQYHSGAFLGLTGQNTPKLLALYTE